MKGVTKLCIEVEKANPKWARLLWRTVNTDDGVVQDGMVANTTQIGEALERRGLLEICERSIGEGENHRRVRGFRLTELGRQVAAELRRREGL